jgi:glycine cleavage system H protein
MGHSEIAEGVNFMHYTESHEWISLDGSIGTVGITEYAQKELGSIVYIELPKIGQEVKAGEGACVLESTKAAVDVYSPVSGKIIAVNDDLRTNPESLKEMTAVSGWLFRVELTQPSECKRLLSLAQYQSLHNRPPA